MPVTLLLGVATAAGNEPSGSTAVGFGELPDGAVAIGQMTDVRTEICRDLLLDQHVIASLCFMAAGSMLIDGFRVHGADPMPMARHVHQRICSSRPGRSVYNVHPGRMAGPFRVVRIRGSQSC